VTDLAIYEDIANMQDCLDLCAQYNSNLTATSSPARHCSAAVYVFSVDDSLAPEGGSKANACCLKDRTGVNVTVSYEVVNATVLQA